MTRERTTRYCPECGGAVLADSSGCSECGWSDADDGESVDTQAPTSTLMGSPEETIDGRYEVRRSLGSGGFGTVFAVVDRTNGLELALKIPHVDPTDTRGVRARFETEIKALHKLNHHRLVPIRANGTTERGQPYYTMPFCKGRSLGEAIAADGPFEVRRALRIADAILEALAYVHSKDILHRDLKPANVMLEGVGEAEEVRVLDFGIAKILGDDHRAGPHQTRGAIGTPLYMAPEQFDDAGSVDCRSDVYAAGATLYHMLSGRPPHTERRVLAIARAARRGEIASIRSIRGRGAISARLERIVQRALLPEADRRFQTAEEFRAELRSVDRPTRNPAPVALLASLAVALVLWWVWRPESKANAQPLAGPLASAIAGDELLVVSDLDAPVGGFDLSDCELRVRTTHRGSPDSASAASRTFGEQEARSLTPRSLGIDGHGEWSLTFEFPGLAGAELDRVAILLDQEPPKVRLYRDGKLVDAGDDKPVVLESQNVLLHLVDDTEVRVIGIEPESLSNGTRRFDPESGILSFEISEPGVEVTVRFEDRLGNAGSLVLVYPRDPTPPSEEEEEVPEELGHRLAEIVAGSPLADALSTAPASFVALTDPSDLLVEVRSAGRIEDALRLERGVDPSSFEPFGESIDLEPAGEDEPSILSFTLPQLAAASGAISPGSTPDPGWYRVEVASTDAGLLSARVLYDPTPPRFRLEGELVDVESHHCDVAAAARVFGLERIRVAIADDLGVARVLKTLGQPGEESSSGVDVLTSADPDGWISVDLLDSSVERPIVLRAFDHAGNCSQLAIAHLPLPSIRWDGPLASLASDEAIDLADHEGPLRGEVTSEGFDLAVSYALDEGSWQTLGEAGRGKFSIALEPPPIGPERVSLTIRATFDHPPGEVVWTRSVLRTPIPEAPEEPGGVGTVASPVPAADPDLDRRFVPGWALVPVADDTVWDEVRIGGDDRLAPRFVVHEASGLEMALIPAGSFTIGAPENDELAESCERPAHRVELSSSFYLARTEVTWKIWTATGGRSSKSRPSWSELDMPAVHVSWKAAKDWCRDLGLRLPTEAEWEYAARAGEQRRFPWGSSLEKGAGWANLPDRSYSELPGPGMRQAFSFDDGFGRTSPVGRFKPNGFGLYDMIGNVWEWCSDFYSEATYRDRTIGRDPTEPITDPGGPGSRAGLQVGHVMRGGSWNSFPAHTRFSWRSFRKFDEASDAQGVRPAADLH